MPAPGTVLGNCSALATAAASRRSTWASSRLIRWAKSRCILSRPNVQRPAARRSSCANCPQCRRTKVFTMCPAVPCFCSSMTSIGPRQELGSSFSHPDLSQSTLLLLFPLLLGFLLLFGCFLFLTLVLILFSTFVSHCVTPFRSHLSFRCEECSRTADFWHSLSSLC